MFSGHSHRETPTSRILIVRMNSLLTRYRGRNTMPHMSVRRVRMLAYFWFQWHTEKHALAYGRRKERIFPACR